MKHLTSLILLVKRLSTLPTKLNNRTIMHVDEGGAFSGHTIKLELVNERGDSRMFEVSPEILVDKLKIMVLGLYHCVTPLNSNKLSQQHKLVSILKKKQLDDERTLRDEDVADGDIILLLTRCYSTGSNGTPQDKLLGARGPSEGEIIAATANLPPKNMDKKVLELGATQDVSSTYLTDSYLIIILLV